MIISSFATGQNRPQFKIWTNLNFKGGVENGVNLIYIVAHKMGSQSCFPVIFNRKSGKDVFFEKISAKKGGYIEGSIS